jgi:competence protein ComEA
MSVSEPSGSCDPRPPASVTGTGRLLDLYHRIRTGEDPIAFGAVVLVVALAAGFFWYRAGLGGGGAEAAGALPQPPGARPGPAVTSSTTGAAALVVHVAGAVRHPGLYRLAPGSRVADAVDAAGGPQAGADLDRLNLAGRLADGQRVAVARRGQPDPPGPLGPGAGAEVETLAGATGPAEPVDLNTAGPAELQTLPGVGPATARAILEERTRRGGFKSPRDLLRVPGIGERRFARLRDRVRV